MTIREGVDVDFMVSGVCVQQIGQEGFAGGVDDAVEEWSGCRIGEAEEECVVGGIREDEQGVRSGV